MLAGCVLSLVWPLATFAQSPSRTSDTICVLFSEPLPGRCARLAAREGLHGERVPRMGLCKGAVPEIGISTNGLLLAALVPNIGLKVHVKGPWSVEADWMCARWSRSARHRYWRLHGGDVAVKYRLTTPEPYNSFTGHHLGLYASLLCYDFQFGHRGVLSDDWNYAVGLSYTYSLALTRRLNLDFSLGVGYLWGRYKKHRPIDDHDVWESTHNLRWFGPTQAGVSLVWNIGTHHFNQRKAKKGGAR